MATTRLVVSVPKHLHGKIIGHHGATKNDIENDYGVHLIFPDRNNSEANDIIIEGSTNKSLRFAETRILDIAGLNPANKVIDEIRNSVEEVRREKDDLFAQAHAAPRNSPMRNELFNRANAAKNHLLKLEAEAGKKIFQVKNKGYGLDQMDLHGLRVDEALMFVDERLNTVVDKLISGQLAKLVIIVGAGHHSQGGIAKIKPGVKELLDKRHFAYEDDPENSGQIFVYGPSSTSKKVQPPPPYTDPCQALWDAVVRFFGGKK